MTDPCDDYRPCLDTAIRIADEANARADAAEAEWERAAEATERTYSEALQAARALADELAEKVRWYAPEHPPSKVNLIGSHVCAQCEVHIEKEYGPMKSGMYEWVKDATPHDARCRWVRARAALAKWEASR